jgi:IS30 family transposase
MEQLKFSSLQICVWQLKDVEKKVLFKKRLRKLNSGKFDEEKGLEKGEKYHRLKSSKDIPTRDRLASFEDQPSKEYFEENITTEPKTVKKKVEIGSSMICFP